MSNDESILSGASGTGADGGSQAHLVNVLANAVETQKSVASQLSALFDHVEEARNETRGSVATLTDEIRNLEIRSNTMFEEMATQLAAQNEALHSSHAAQLIAQNEALHSSHEAERAQLIAQNENLLNRLNSTINSAPRPDLTPQQIRDLQTQMSQDLQLHIQHIHPQGLLLGIKIAQQCCPRMIQQRQQHETRLASRAATSSTAAVPSAPVAPAAPTMTSVPPRGEENETVRFSGRCEIFRYIHEPNQNMIRLGEGVLKLLHDEANNKFRLVIRLDQVYKLYAIFSVLKTSLTTEGQDNVRFIVVTDFAEDENGDLVTLCLKFMNAEVAKEFEKAFGDARSQLQ